MKRSWMLIAALFVSMVAFGQQSNEYLNDQSEEKVAFWSAQGWIFNEETKTVEDAVELSSLTPLNGAPELTAATFHAKTFDPQQYTIPLNSSQPTFVNVPGKGTIYFHSVQRFETLWSRHQINEQAKAKK
ncbi:MAG: hypothetical protein MK081_14980 [Flavobacteriales bacterium]|nr:hypothetical protein [Flavobacteriales bacterium]